MLETIANLVPEGFWRWYGQTGVYVFGSFWLVLLITGTVLLRRMPPSPKKALLGILLVAVFFLGVVISALLTDAALVS